MFLQLSGILFKGEYHDVISYYGQQTPSPHQDGTTRHHPQEWLTPQGQHHPTPRDSTTTQGRHPLRSASGRYASYWNAFLLL